MAIRAAFRGLFRNRSFVLVSIVTLALTIGVNATIFSLLNALLFRPLPVPDREQLVRVFSLQNGQYNAMSYPNFADLRQASGVSEIAAYSWPTPVSLAAAGERTAEPSERKWAVVVTGNYFNLLGVRAVAGRTFLPEEDKTPNLRPVVVISNRLWKERFNADPRAVGQTLKINGKVFDIIGVTPERIPQPDPLFTGDLWTPMMMQAQVMPGQEQKLTARGETWLSVLGRINEGSTIPVANAAAMSVARRLQQEYPGTNSKLDFAVVSERQGRTLILPGVEQFGMVLLVVVGLVLLVACANIAGLAFAWSLARRKEFSIRLCLGASRWRVARQVLAECIPIALFGGIAGVALSMLGTKALLRLTPPLPIEIALDAHVDVRVVLYAFALASLGGFVFSILPALGNSKVDFTPVLKASDAGPQNIKQNRMWTRDVLVVVQIAVTLIVLIAAGLFARSMAKAQLINPGFDPADRLLATVDAGVAGYSGEQSRRLGASLLEDIRRLPGVIDATATGHAPLGPGYFADSRVFVEGAPDVPDDQRPSIHYDVVASGYFRTMGTAVLRGRDFSVQDQAASRAYAIVNQSFAQRILASPDPVGKRFKLDRKSPTWIEVAGLVPDGKYESLGETPHPHAFLSGFVPSITFVLHTTGDPGPYAQAVRKAVNSVNPSLVVTDVKSMNEHLGFALYPARTGAFLLGTFGVLGLVLSMVGLYGLLSFLVRRRTHEVGIRLALGAQRRQVLMDVVRRGSILVGIGIVLGMAVAYAGARVLSPMLYGVGSNDPVTFLGVPAFLIAVSLASMMLPAIAASRVDPMTSLRYE